MAASASKTSSLDLWLTPGRKIYLRRRELGNLHPICSVSAAGETTESYGKQIVLDGQRLGRRAPRSMHLELRSVYRDSQDVKTQPRCWTRAS